MKLKTIKNLNLKNKKVLVRVDLNVPMKNGRIIDDSRIQAALPTIKYLLEKKAKIILISHLGKPLKNKKPKIKNNRYAPKLICPTTPERQRGESESNQKQAFVCFLAANYKKYSLKPVYQNLKLKIENLKFVDDCIGQKVKKEIDKMKVGDIVLLENLRFYPGEEDNDLKFAKQLAELAEIYINDAFAVCHREHASVSAITNFLPSYAGFLLEKEAAELSRVLYQSRHPLIVLMGGVKISTKIKVIQNLAKKLARRSSGEGGADKILIGGALANNFFAAQGLSIGQSVYEKEMVSLAKRLLKNKNIILPIDVKIKSKVKSPRSRTISLRGRQKSIRQSADKIQNLRLNQLNQLKSKNFKILDIGPETIKLFSEYLSNAKMIIWNGPMGYSEDKHFISGTREIIKAIINNKKAKVVIGGGETIASLQAINPKIRILDSGFWISTGGGAMLKFLGGKTLPGISPLLLSADCGR